MRYVKRAVLAKVCAMLAIYGVLAGGANAALPGGEQYGVHRVEAQATDSFQVVFYGGEQAVVWVDGDGDTDLDLYVYDAQGHLVACDNDTSDVCVVRFTPPRTGKYWIEVRNLGRVYNRYEILAA